MSLETARAFIEHIASTGDAALDAFKAESGAWNLDQLVEQGAAAGFQFDHEAIKAAITEMLAGELGEADLDQVAGGLSGFVSLSSKIPRDDD